MSLSLLSTTAINGDTLNGDSDMSSTSSQTSSEHDPSLRTQIQTYNISPTKTWPDESTPYFLPPPPADLISTTTQLPNRPVAPTTFNSLKDIPSNDSSVKTFDQVPEYKLFGSNGPSIHSLLFGNNENSQQQQSQRPVINGIDHDLREIEKRLMGKMLLSTMIRLLFFVSF